MSRKTKEQKIIAVVGPTASGKSDLAVDIARFIRKNARRFGAKGAEIVSADSRQIYKGFNLVAGTVPRDRIFNFKSQISKENREVKTKNLYSYREIRHHLTGIASPRKTLSVTQYQRKALAAIRGIMRRGNIPIVCGGTGLYVDSILYGTRFPTVKPNLPLRKKLEKLSSQKLFVMLLQKDPARAAVIDRYNKRRLVRALEIIAATKKPIQPLVYKQLFDTLAIGIALPKEMLQRKIRSRIFARLKKGMVGEVRRLHHSGLSWKRLESFGLELKWISRLLQKKITKREMIEGLYKDTCAYAKRQMTWFKRNKDIVWIEEKNFPQQR